MSRWLKILLLGLAVAGVALLTLPWWLALPLRPILGHWDITFEHYEREGYAHFRLRQLRYAKGPVEVTAGEVHAPTPLLWLAQRLGATPPRLTAANWRVQPAPGPKTPSAPNPDSGWVRLHATLQRVAARLATWLPQAELANGEVRGFGPRLYFQRVTWHDRQLDADGLGFIGQALAANLATGNNTFLLRAHNRTNEAALQLAWTEADMKGAVTLWTQSAPVTAHFPARGWLPAEASVTAENWTLPAGRVQLGAPYATVQGGARLLWRDTAFEADAEARAVPAPGAKQAPPFSARAAAHGNLRELVLTALAVDAPFAQARLSAPVTFSLDAPATAAPAELAVKVDLGKLPWIDAHGRAEGTVRVTGRDASARQDFVLEFADVELPRIVLKKAQARGHLQWPVLELAGLTAQLDETSTVEAHGALNWQTRELSDVVIKAQAGPAWLAAWPPAGTTWSAAEISATATGPLAAPQLAGSAKVTAFARAPLHPTDVDATWHSAGGVTAVAATARAGGSRLEFAGTIDAQGAELTKLEFSPGGSPVARLVAPARVVFAPAWSVDTLQLAGPGGQLGFQGHGGRDGAFQLSASGFDSAWLRDWVTLSGPAWQLHALRAQGRFERGALVFSTEAAAQIAMNPRPAEVKLGATGDADGVQLQELTVTESGRVLTRISGRLPLSCVLDPDPVVRISETAALELSASTEPDSPLWATLADFTGLQLVEPSARLELKGTVHEPTGQVDLRAARIGAVAGRFPHELPELTELALAARLERAAVTLTTFSAKVDGQAVTARGHVPMDDAGWKQLWSKPAAFDWSQASAQIDIPNADLAPVARRFPKFVAAQGFLRAKIALEPGARFSGELHLRDAATRPLAPFGTLQEIQADLALHDRVLAIQSLGAKLGGEPVALTGGVTFVPGGAPRLALGLKGTNLPVVRNTGLLLRADFDLQADTDAAGVTTLGGRVEVRDCLLLASLNLRTLLPGAKGVTRQPPYFSVEPEPYAHWPLAVDVRARHSIRLRTSVFNGTASGHFRLGGTLGEPRAVGEVTTDEGRVLFPFATFTVKSGSVRLREADPFHAIVALTATSQRRDYQLQLEATGELPSPNILLSSSPALEPGEVLLLVMTGQPPESMATTATNSSGTQRLALLGAYLSRGLFQDLGAGGEDRLEISAGAEVSEQGRDTYEFEYKLGERSSLVGEYDRFDSYNGGFKWRAYTQESTPVEKK
jgi:translocation and assembly module TamB